MKDKDRIETLEKEVALLRELLDLRERLAKYKEDRPYIPHIPVQPVQPYVPYPDPWRPWITYTDGTAEITSSSFIVDGNRIIS
jgi:hypothetical protein